MCQVNIIYQVQIDGKLHISGIPSALPTAQTISNRHISRQAVLAGSGKDTTEQEGSVSIVKS